MAAHKELVDFITEYFTDEPNASVNDCARDADACGIPVRRDIISAIRRDMRAARPVPTTAPKPVLTVVPSPYQFADKPPVVMPKVEVPVPQEEIADKKATPIAERRSYYDDLLLADSTITITKAMKQVKAKFGKSVDVGYALATLKMVRELHKSNSPPQPKEAPKAAMSPPPQKAPEAPVQKPAEKPKEVVSEYVLMYVDPSKKTQFEVVKPADIRKSIFLLVAKGIDPDAIKVYEPSKVKLSVKVSFE